MSRLILSLIIFITSLSEGKSDFINTDDPDGLSKIGSLKRLTCIFPVIAYASVVIGDAIKF